MYRFYVNSKINDKHYGDMLRVFFGEDEFEVITLDLPAGAELPLRENTFLVNKDKAEGRNVIKTELYNLGRELTGITPEWGILTGVRPLKLAYDVLQRCSSREEFEAVMKDEYLVSETKIKLLTEIMDYQDTHIAKPDESAALYVHIPFCPTKCSYCSFASVECEGTKQTDEYLDALDREIKYASELAAKNGMKFESVYIGGGTPTVLTDSQLKRLLGNLNKAFGINPRETEFTLEAGRPDTIDEAKLQTISEIGISRISINPQSMHDRTLAEIGRNHSAEAICETFRLADEYSFDCVNADLIAGLSDETPEDFHYSLKKLVDLGAENITVHTLSVKRGSRLRENDPDFYRKDTERVDAMLKDAHDYLMSYGYHPYYIYRQKHQMGALENVGYCLENKHSLYNIRIMEEKQTILALGAGGIGKVYDPVRNCLTRIPNVGNYRVYIDRIDDMLKRKDKYFI